MRIYLNCRFLTAVLALGIGTSVVERANAQVIPPAILQEFLYDLQLRKIRRSLLKLAPERAPTLAVPDASSSHVYFVSNVIAGNRLWTATFDLEKLEKVEFVTTPLGAGQFHAAIAVYFREPAQMLSAQGKEISTSKAFVLGTGPTIPFSLGSIIGQQSITMRTKTFEQQLAETPKLAHHRRWIDPSRVDPRRVVVAFLEESSRLHFLQQLRILKIQPEKWGKGGDEFRIGRYTLFDENCVSSGTRNLSASLRLKEDRRWVLSHPVLKKDVRSFDRAPSEAEYRAKIELFAAASRDLEPALISLAEADEWSRTRVANEALTKRSEIVDRALAEAAAWRSNFGGRDHSISIPHRARYLFDAFAPEIGPSP